MKLKINDQVPDTEVYQLVNGEPQKSKLMDTLGKEKIILFGPQMYPIQQVKDYWPEIL